MRPVLLFCTGPVLLTGVLAGLVLFSRNPGGPRPPMDGVSSDASVGSILARSCEDCHSDQTQWPWYGYIPPVSWMLNNDVQQARIHMNLSQWNTYSPDDKRQILTEMAAVVRNLQMPPARYLYMHPGARLTRNDIAALYAWAKSERRKLRRQPASGKS